MKKRILEKIKITNLRKRAIYIINQITLQEIIDYKT